MADKNVNLDVNVNVKSNVKGSIAELKQLKLQLKQTAAGSDEFKKLYNQIDDLEENDNRQKRKLDQKDHKNSSYMQD